VEKIESKRAEAAAIERVADCARQVQAATVALEAKFNATGDEKLPLPLARLTAAMSELQAARDALDALLAARIAPFD
jgi:hypothetical protein